MKPSTSVVLPVFNGETTIEAAVASILRQTCPDWELILVDDGSTDHTPRVLQRLAASDPRIRLFARPHRGIVDALNFGLAQTQGRFVARMDADDLSHPERLARQSALLDNRPDIGLVGCQVEFGGAPSAQRGFALHVEWANSLIAPEEIARKRFIESPLPHPTVLFRRRLVEEHGGYAVGDFPEDYELWLRWLEHGVRMTKVPEVLLLWRDSPGRLSRSDSRYSVEAFYRCKALYLARELKRLNPPRPILVWGAGRVTRRRARLLHDHGIAIAAYIDIDPKKTGRRLDNRPVISPDAIPPPDRAFILAYVGTRGARDAIHFGLTRAGYCEGRDFFLCA